MKITALILVLATAAFAQTGVVPVLAGVALHLGMSRDATLAKLAVAPKARLQEVNPDSYMVLTGDDNGLLAESDVVFKGDILTRICLYIGGQTQTAASLVLALFKALATKGDWDGVKLWVGTNPRPVTETKEVHLMFSDREIVVSTSKRGAEAASVQVYFPKMLAGEPERK